MRAKKSAKKSGSKRKIFAPVKKSRLRRFAKIHTLLTAFLLIFYVAVGFSIDPLCLKYDLSDKLAHAQEAAVNLTVHVAGPPEKPSLTAAPECHADSADVRLNWTATNDTTSYDILRDGAVLVSGIASTSYKDTNVTTENIYSYQLVANGTLGATTSDEVSATTGNCFVPIPPPACAIVTLDQIDLTNFSNIPKITNRTPTITGTTNIPNAIMRFEIYSGPAILVSSTANSNGYWSVTIPEKLDIGLHTIFVTATDPVDSARSVTSQLIFEIAAEGQSKSSSERSGSHPAKSSTPPEKTTVSAPTQSVATAPFALILVIGNKDKIVYTGTDLMTILSISKLHNFALSDNLIKYEIVDASGQTVLEKELTLHLEDGKTYPENIRIPEYLKAGKYTVRAETRTGIFLISAENKFELRERPILNLGGGMTITYSSLVSSLGYVFFVFFLVLLIFLFLLGREYWLSKYATLQIDEKELAKDGFIS